MKDAIDSVKSKIRGVLATLGLPMLLALGVLSMTATSRADAGDDLRAILQLVLNDPKLTQYYHFDVRPERRPLAIVNHTSVAFDPAGVTAAGQPVARGADDGKSLAITAFAVSGDEAEIAFTYRVEGVMASGKFRRVKGQWKTEHLSVAEGS